MPSDDFSYICSMLDLAIFFNSLYAIIKTLQTWKFVTHNTEDTYMLTNIWRWRRFRHALALSLFYVYCSTEAYQRISTSFGISTLQFLVESELLICFWYCVRMILVTSCSFCVCFKCLVFVPGLHSFDYRCNLGTLVYSFFVNDQTNINLYANV